MPMTFRNVLICLLLVVVPGTAARAQSQASQNAQADAVVVIVSSQQALAQLNRQQVEDLFLGRSATFPDGSQAIAVDQAEDSPVRERFYRDILGRSAAQMRSYWARQIFTGRSRPPRTVSSTDAVLQLINEDSRVISYIEKSRITPAVKVVAE